MNAYRIVIMNNKRNRPEIIMEMKRKRFTRREYNMTIQEMFMLAAESIDYQHLTAEIYCNGIKVESVDCDTMTDCSRIDALISSQGRFIRQMAVAY